MTSLSKYAWITSALTLIGGFLFLHFGVVGYGFAFFIIFPMAVGFAIGTYEKNNHVFYSLVFGTLLFFGFLLAGALEGFICVLMAAPLFILMIFIGYKMRQKIMKSKVNKSRKLMISITPILVLLIIDPIEQVILPEPRVITITDSVILNYPAALVFDEVKQMDKLDAAKPIGLLLGLPSPYQCELEADSIGARRNCLFKNGIIVAEITKYEKGEILEMDVIDYTLTGREWFEFIDAKYTFEEINYKTMITRSSSYKSILNPRFYWKPLESWGIKQEHIFVLNSLKKNLNEKYRNEDVHSQINQE